MTNQTKELLDQIASTFYRTRSKHAAIRRCRADINRALDEIKRLERKAEREHLSDYAFKQLASQLNEQHRRIKVATRLIDSVPPLYKTSEPELRRLVHSRPTGHLSAFASVSVPGYSAQQIRTVLTGGTL